MGDLRQTAFLQAYLAGAVGIGGDPARGEALIAESEQLLESLGDANSFEANFVALIQGWLALMARGFNDPAEEQLEAALALGRLSTRRESSRPRSPSGVSWPWHVVNW